MKKTIFLVLVLCSSAVLHAQTSRRTIEKYATESTKQIAITNRTPTIDILDSLANNAEVSIEMLSRMAEPDDTRQQRACMRLIDDIVGYSLTESGRRYVDVVRNGLKKAVDRSFEPDVQLHILEQLALVAKPADAQHIAMWLEVPELSATVSRILTAMPSDIDNNIAEAAASQPGIKDKVKTILDVHSGKTVAAPVAVKAKPAAPPFWTESLDREIGDMGNRVADLTNSIVIGNEPKKALPLLMALARQKEGGERNGVLAVCAALADKAGLTPEERYLVFREADELASDENLRRKLVVALGETGTVQSLAYLLRYYGKAGLEDALALAAVDIIGSRPETNGGRVVSGMLYAAKQSFIRHYDEQGVDSYIDRVLAAIDNWRADGGYNANHSENTTMEKRGFWIIHDELADFDLAFDWKAEGDITLSLRSMPVLTLNRERGVRISGDSRWHTFVGDADGWCTANVDVTGDKVSVRVNGQTVIDNATLVSGEPGTQAQKVGYVRFLADDNGAAVRGYCYRKK